MSPILDIHQMSEEDIKLHYITPALQKKGWGDYITMETSITARDKTGVSVQKPRALMYSDVQFTDGRINISGNVIVREAPKKADYVLYNI